MREARQRKNTMGILRANNRPLSLNPTLYLEYENPVDCMDDRSTRIDSVVLSIEGYDQMHMVLPGSFSMIAVATYGQ